MAFQVIAQDQKYRSLLQLSEGLYVHTLGQVRLGKASQLNEEDGRPTETEGAGERKTPSYSSLGSGPREHVEHKNGSNVGALDGNLQDVHQHRGLMYVSLLPAPLPAEL